MLIKHFIYPFTGQSFIGYELTYLATLGNMICCYKINYHSIGVEILISTA
jgi:hypothetical protein